MRKVKENFIKEIEDESFGGTGANLINLPHCINLPP